MSASMVSRETPSQDVPSFDHRVTQCRSTVKVSVGRSRNDFQSHLRRTFVPSSITNSQRSSDTCGVGPADKTGKSVGRTALAVALHLRRCVDRRNLVRLYSYALLLICVSYRTVRSKLSCRSSHRPQGR